MAKKKSIVEKFTDTMKSLADNASQALKAEEPPHVDETAAGYVPYAAEGLAFDPMLPVAAQPVRKRRAAKKATGRSAGKRARNSSSKSAAKASTRKAAGKKTVRRPAGPRSKAAASARKTSRKTTKRGRRKGLGRKPADGSS